MHAPGTTPAFGPAPLGVDGDSASETAEEIGDSAASLWSTAVDALPRVGVAVAIVALGWLLSRAVRWGLERWWRRRQTTSFARVMSKVVGWIVLAVIVLLAIAVTFPSVRPVDLLAGLGFFSVAVGFAFQDILENTLAGVLLLFRQPFTSGDQVRVLDQEGTVEGITIRETRVRSYDGELVVIPNRDVYKNVIVVGTDGPVQRQTFVVGVDYATDLERATATVVAALRTVEGIASVPPPHALVSGLGASTIDIDVRFWSTAQRASLLEVRDRAIVSVKRALDEAGVEMPTEIVTLEARTSVRDALGTDARGSAPVPTDRSTGDD